MGREGGRRSKTAMVVRSRISAMKEERKSGEKDRRFVALIGEGEEGRRRGKAEAAFDCRYSGGLAAQRGEFLSGEG